MSHGNEPLRLSAVLDLARRVDLATFGARLGGPVLVCQQPTDMDDDGWSFNTASVVTSVVEAAPGRELVLHADDAVHVVRKARVQAAFARTVLIGRADSNDVHLPHPSVSKLHARIQLDAEGRFSLSDASSHNGTELDGRRLPPEQPAELADGSWIRIGDLAMCFLGVERLHEVLRRIR